MGSDYKTKKRTETRQFPNDLLSRSRDTETGLVTINTDFSKIHPIISDEWITSRGNPGWNHGPGSNDPLQNPAKKYFANTDRGGTCDHVKYSMFASYEPMRTFTTNYKTTLETPVFVDAISVTGRSRADLTNFEFWNLPVISEAEMTVLGQRLSAIMNPLRPHAGLFQTIIELRREGLPTLKSAVLSSKGPFGKLRGTADDWLNFSFGIKPLWTDLMSTAQALMDTEALLIQFRRDAGRQVRRHTDRRPIELSNTVSSQDSYGYPTPVIAAFKNGHGTTTTSTVVTRETWFSGAFKYALPAGDSLLAQLQSMNQESRYLLGLSFDPKTVWSVLGWSWLVDWVVNVGPVLENFTQTYLDKSVMSYGYLMSVDEWTQERSYFADMLTTNGGYYRYSPFTKETYRHFKRRQASPFGFGVSWTGFSPFQLSILASLGISKGRP